MGVRLFRGTGFVPSNVDIATEFTKLIVAQRAYSANTKVVSATDELLQESLGLARLSWHATRLPAGK